MRDVCIIGAGIAGCSCARELSAYELDVVVVDSGYDVSCGTTRANSGIVHGGYDPVPGTLKAKFNLQGSLMFEDLSRELGFSYRRCGSMVVAFSQDEVPSIEALLERGIQNGVEGLQILDSQALHDKEPNINPEAVAALWVPTGAIVDPYGACLAFAENAVDNGVEFKFLSEVVSVEKVAGGFEVEVVNRETGAHEKIAARTVVNASGLYSGKINSMVSSKAFTITPRAGEYFLLDKTWGDAFHSTIFQVPTKNGKGVLVSPTTGGNIILGPTAVPRKSPEETQTTTEGLAQVLENAGKTWPNIPTYDIITNFAGLRASCLDDGDFHIGQPDDAPGFFNIGGFDSPGLTAAPAVAKEITSQIAEMLYAVPNKSFNPHREAPRRFSTMTNEERSAAIAEDSRWGRIICRCEEVSEAEIVAAIHSPIQAYTTDSIKWRTRAGMGRCQAGFCLPLVAGIIARETGCDVTEVRKGNLGSRLAIGHRGCLDALPEVTMPEGMD
ncbi:MAG: NAD(P)/FAD-dependent oxidoreductase [Coriobacteriales bacterium]|jgi:glycerol-3-phosphate dehydrogenase